MSAEQSVGKIVQVIGPVVDVEFEPGKLPSIMNRESQTDHFRAYV